MQYIEANINYYIFRHIYIINNSVVLHYFTKDVVNFKRKKIYNFINANTKITKRVKRKVVNLFY